jgi:hypothetical protein
VPPRWSRGGADPFGPLDRFVRQPPWSGAAPFEVWANEGILNFGDGRLDPLAALGGPIVAQPELPPVNWQQASALSTWTYPGSARSCATAATPSSAIPDNWELGSSR